MHPTNTVVGFRLSPQQRRLWNFQQSLLGNSRAFCAQLVLLLEGELRTRSLQEALAEVCRRNEVLRTVFRRLPGVALPVQSVEEIAPSWEARDLRGLDATLIEQAVSAETKREFDYENGPIVCATLFALEPERHLISITLPALCADRQTLRNLFI